MPQMNKEALSQYIRTECRRQLRLYLSPDNAQYRPERHALGMPDPQPPRPGLQLVRRAGDEWQAAKLSDLTTTFGLRNLIGNPRQLPNGAVHYDPKPLQDALAQAVPHAFIVEGEFEITAAFEAAHNIAGYRQQFLLDYARVRPDLIDVLPPASFDQMIDAFGSVQPVPRGDRRLQLRVIDIKLTSEPSPSYFAEIAYYSLALAGWLVDNQLDQSFVVVPNGAVWPGSHDASRLTVVWRQLTGQGLTPSAAQLRAAMSEDLEPIPFEVFALRIRRFLQEDLQEVLSQPWQDLQWHVDNRCQSCENLGYHRVNSQGQATELPDHCIPTAHRIDQLDRVAFISRGARAALESRGIKDVTSLAQRQPADQAFNAHQTLRATRTVVAQRAASLGNGQAVIPQLAGTSAIMPKWTDLHVYLSVDFDLGSAITVAFGCKGFWVEPRPYGSNNPAPRQTLAYPSQEFVVENRDLPTEQRELLAFLRAIWSILDDASKHHPETTVQFYLWDTLQYDHLTRVIGRHLQAVLNDPDIRDLAWLFPPEDILPNAELATRRSAITIVREVVRAVLAAPIPHYYTLLEVARLYHTQNLQANLAQFTVPRLFENELSDQIPSERAHEIWSRSAQPHWQRQLGNMRRTIAVRLMALEEVTRQLELDLRPTLGDTAAPPVSIRPPRRVTGVSADGQLWYSYAKLDEALKELKVHQTRAMPPHEREARFQSARLMQRVTGQREARELQRLGLQPAPGRRIYEMRPSSREVKMREGDFNFALAPEGQPEFLGRKLFYFAQRIGMALPQWVNPSMQVEDVTGVTIVAIDRENGILVFDSDRRWPSVLDQLEQNGVNLTTNVILDPTYDDYFTRKLQDCLHEIGNPASARTTPLVQLATGQPPRTRGRQTAHTPTADFLWDGGTMHQARVNRVLQPVQTALQGHGLDLNPTQWNAWHEALSRRLQLIWGPPGTGKSRTARAIVDGAALEAAQQNHSIRILITGFTYTAVDNVLLSVASDAAGLLGGANCELHRLRPSHRSLPQNVPVNLDTEFNLRQPTQKVRDLKVRLQNQVGITIVGATPEQLYNLLKLDGGTAKGELFDLILVDEASQMDVAHAILPLCSLAAGGSVILAGDPTQLPPIHEAEPPIGLESMVGPIYTFYRANHQVPQIMLDVNYRSNREIVEFCLNAGYQATLSSFSPDMRLNLGSPIPTAQPNNWPATLFWSPNWAALLDPDHPTTCFVYSDGQSSQWNQFEADAVASMVYLLHGQVCSQPLGERHPVSGQLITAGTTLYTPDKFWEKAVGVVTPHRAQQGLIVSRLQQLFSGTGVSPSTIRNAVDTVERFQGQQRDIIIASFALGDADAIHDEEEFLMSLNRFNVMASRPRTKLVVLVSREVINHLASDLDVLRESKLLKVFAETYCRNVVPMTLGWVDQGMGKSVSGVFRFR